MFPDVSRAFRAYDRSGPFPKRLNFRVNWPSFVFIVSASSPGPRESYSLTTIAKKASLKKAALLLALTIFMIIYVPHPVSAPAPPPVSCGGEPDFSITPSLFELNIVPGSSNSTTLTLTSFYGFAGNVTLSASAYSPDITATPTPASVVLTSGGSKSSTLDVSAVLGTPGGSYTVYVTGSNGTLTQYTSVGVIVPGVPGPDFELSSNPSFSTIARGSTATATISVTSLNGFNGTVTLASSTYPPVATTLSLASVDLTPGATKNSTLTFPTNSSTVPGFYFVTVTGTHTPKLHYTSVFFTVTGPSFELSATPTSVTIPRGSYATVTINVTSLHSFSSPVGLAALTDPGIGWSFSPTSVTPAPDRGLASSLTLSTLPSTALGSHFVHVEGMSGALLNSTFVIVEVTPDFNMTSAPDTLTIQPGGASRSSTITLTSIGGFAGDVAVSLFCPSIGLKASLSPGNVTLTMGGTAPDTLTVSADPNTPTGYYFISVTGIYNGTDFHSTAVYVKVALPDFTISADPQYIVILPGSAMSTITLVSTLDYTNTVTLAETHSAGLTVRCSTTSVYVAPGVNGTSVCTFSATIRGTYRAEITGTAGALSHSVTVYVTITGPTPNFDISASPTTKGPLYPGEHGTATVTVTAVNGFTDTVDLTASPSAGLTATLSATSFPGGSGTSTLDVTAPTAGAYTVTVTGTSGSLVHTTAVITVNVVDFTIAASSPATAATGQSASSTVTVTGVNGFAGSVALSDTPLPAGLSCGAFSPASITGSGTATLSCSSTAAGTYAVTITGTSGSLTHSTTATFTFAVVPDFTITASTPLSVNAGRSASSTITLTALNGFTGDVALSDPPPSGLTCGAITPSSLTLPTSPATATISCSATAAGSYTVTITGTGSSGSHTATATFNFKDFTISATSVGPFVTGASGTSTITVTAQNGFSDVVALTPNPSSGLTATLSPMSATGSGTSTLTVSATAAGTYTVTVTGTGGGLHHTTASVTVTVVVPPPPDFSISASKTSMSIQAGDTAASTITLASLNGFAGTVSVSAAVSPSGPQASLIPTSVMLGASGNSTLTIAVPATVSVGTYTVTVTGTYGSLSHTATVTVSVTAASPAPPQQAASNILGLDPTVFYGLVSILVAAVAGGIGIVVWKKRSSPASTAKLILWAKRARESGLPGTEK